MARPKRFSRRAFPAFGPRVRTLSVANAMGENNMERSIHHIHILVTCLWDAQVPLYPFRPYSATGFARMAIFADEMAEQFVDGKLGASTTILLMTPLRNFPPLELVFVTRRKQSGISSSTVQLALVLPIMMEVVGSSRTSIKSVFLAHVAQVCTANQGITSVANTPLYLEVAMHSSIYMPKRNEPAFY